MYISFSINSQVVHRLPALLALKMSITDLWNRSGGELKSQMHTLIKTCEMQKEKLNEQRRKHAEEVRRLEEALERSRGGYGAPQLPLTGWLQKQGSELSTNWHPRWCELTETSLSFYEQRGDQRPKRVIDLKAIAMVQSSAKKQHGFKITLHEANEKISLDAEYLENRLNWVWALQYSKAFRQGQRLPESPWQAAGMDGLALPSPSSSPRGRSGSPPQSPRGSNSIAANQALARFSTLERNFAQLESNLFQIDQNSWTWVEKKLAAELTRRSGGQYSAVSSALPPQPPSWLGYSSNKTPPKMRLPPPPMNSYGSGGGLGLRNARAGGGVPRLQIPDGGVLPPVPGFTPRGSDADKDQRKTSPYNEAKRQSSSGLNF